MSMEFDGSKPIISDHNSVSEFSVALAADKINALAAAVGEAFGIVETDVFLRSDIETDEEKIAVCGAENSDEYSAETIKHTGAISENISCENSEIYSDNLKVSSNEITETGAEDLPNYSAKAFNNTAAILQKSDRGISERTAAVSLEINAANPTDYSAEALNNGAAILQGSDRGISERTAAVSLETNAEDLPNYSAEALNNSAANLQKSDREISKSTAAVSLETYAEDLPNYCAEALYSSAANSQKSDREISERTAAVSLETNTEDLPNYSVGTIEYSAINSALNETISNSEPTASPIKMLSAFGGLEEINKAAERLRVLSSPSGYVFANALTNADTERNFNIHLNVGGVNLGDRNVRTNGAAVNIDWHDAMMNNGGGQ